MASHGDPKDAREMVEGAGLEVVRGSDEVDDTNDLDFDGGVATETDADESSQESEPDEIEDL